MTTPAPRAVVVGSGVEALVAATLLAQRGATTVVLERSEHPGGRFGPWPGELPGALLLDYVPSVHPGVISMLAQPPGAPARRPIVCVCDADGRSLELTGQLADDERAIGRFSSADAARFGETCKSVGRLAKALVPILHRDPPRSRSNAGDIWTAVMAGRQVLGLTRREMFNLLRWPPMPVADLVEEWFELPLLRALWASHGLFGVFGGPHSAGTAAVLLLREAAERAGAPDRQTVYGDPRSLIGALVSGLAARQGTLRCRSEVDRILVDNDRVVGVTLSDGTRIDADVVVSGLSPRQTLLDLVEPGVLSPETTRRILNIRARATTARALLVVDDMAPLLGHSDDRDAPRIWHTLSTVDDLERGFDAMKYGSWAERPWLELHASPARADQRGCTISVTIHQVPRTLRDGPWHAQRHALTSSLLKSIDGAFPGLTARIVRHHVLTPEDLASTLGVAEAHVCQAELALDQLWMARPALGLGGYRSAVNGLYLCGPGTHPGVGPVGGSGWLAGRSVLRDLDL